MGQDDSDWDVEAITSWLASLILHDLMESNEDEMTHDSWDDLGEIEIKVAGRKFRVEVIDLGEDEDEVE